MKILFLGANDWANISHRMARGLRAAGHDARVFVKFLHVFNYAEDDFTSLAEFTTWTGEGLDWIISTGDGMYDTLAELVARLPEPRVGLATMHVGTAYRNASQMYNKIDATLFKLRIIGGDLYRFALGDPTAVPFFAPPHEVLAELPQSLGPVRVVHSPSNRDVKGTTAILAAVPDVEIIEGSFAACAQQRAGAHVFIDQINDLGGFGAAAVEALAAGSVVLGSQRHIVSEVDAFYPRPPIIDVDAQTLASVVRELRADPVYTRRLQAASLVWAQQHATPEAVGRFLTDRLVAAA